MLGRQSEVGGGGSERCKERSGHKEVWDVGGRSSCHVPSTYGARDPCPSRGIRRTGPTPGRLRRESRDPLVGSSRSTAS